jgi:hypothetical protein
MTVFYVHLVIDQPQNEESGVVQHSWRHGPSITYKITPCWVTLLQLARRAAVLDQPSCLRSHWIFKTNLFLGFFHEYRSNWTLFSCRIRVSRKGREVNFCTFVDTFFLKVFLCTIFNTVSVQSRLRHWLSDALTTLLDLIQVDTFLLM